MSHAAVLPPLHRFVCEPEPSHQYGGVAVEPMWLTFRRKSWTNGIAVLSKLNIVEPPVDVATIINTLGIDLQFIHGLDVSGTAVTSETEAKITINADENRRRQRFSMAHELGHVLLHSLGSSFRDSKKGNLDWWDHSPSPVAHNRGRFGEYQPAIAAREQQANSFAATLLVPLKMLEAARSRCRTMRDFMEHFDVNARVIERRFDDLGVRAPGA